MKMFRGDGRKEHWAATDEEDFDRPAPPPRHAPGKISRTMVLARARHAQPPAKPPGLIPDGAGQPLPESVRAPFEAAMGREYRDVRIHTDGPAAQAAASMGANAFTAASDIYFGTGQYAPGTGRGDRVIAHELVHVGQYQDGRIPAGGGVSAPDDPLEREAYGAEQSIVAQVQQMRSGSVDTGDGSGDGAGQGRTGTPADQEHAVAVTTASPTSGHAPMVHRDAGGAPGSEPVRQPIMPPEPVDDTPEPGAQESRSSQPASADRAEDKPTGAPAPAPMPAGAPPGAPVLQGRNDAGHGDAASVTVEPAVFSPIQADIPNSRPADMAPSAMPDATGAGPTAGDIQGAGVAVRAQVSAGAASVETAIAGHVDALSSGIQTSIANARAAVDSTFDAQIQAVAAAAEQAHTQVQEALSACVAELRASHAQTLGEAESDRAARHADADAEIEAARARMTAMGEREAARARQGSEERAQRALELANVAGRGDDASVQAQHQAAQKIAVKTAETIRAKGESLAQGATQAAADAAGQLDGAADSYHEEVDTSYNGVIEQLARVLDATVSALEQQTGGVSEQIQSTGDAAVQHLDGQRQAAHRDLDALEPHATDSVKTAATALIESLNEHVEAGLGLIDSQIDSAVADAGTQLAAAEDPASARAMSDEVCNSLQQAGADIVASLAQAQATSITELDALAGQVDDKLATLLDGVSTAANAAGQEAVSRMNEAAGTVLQGLAGVAARGSAELQGLLDDARTKLDEAKQGLSQSLDKQATAVDQELTSKVTDGLAEEDQQLARSQSTIEQAVGEIAGEYDSLKAQGEQSTNRRVQRGFWSSVVSAVSSAVSAIANWLMDSFLPWLGGAILGFLATAVMLVIAAVVVAALLAAGPWGWVALGVLAIGMISMLISRRYDEWVADLGKPDFWDWCGIVGLAILDITGIVLIFEGLFCKRITGGELEPFEGGWRFGEGVAMLLGTVLAVRARLKGGKGGEGKGGEGKGGAAEKAAAEKAAAEKAAAEKAAAEKAAAEKAAAEKAAAEKAAAEKAAAEKAAAEKAAAEKEAAEKAEAEKAEAEKAEAEKAEAEKAEAEKIEGELTRDLKTMKGNAQKDLTRPYDFSNDPKAPDDIGKVWEDAYSSEYRSQRKSGAEAKPARKAAKSAADKQGKAFAKNRAIEAAQARAQGDLDSGEAFTQTSKKNLASDRAEFDAGSHAGNAQRLAAELNGKSMAEVQGVLDADASAGLCTKTSQALTVKGGKTVPQDAYLYPDGTLVRVKSAGDGINSNSPMYSIEVIKKGITSPQTQSDVAFKVDGSGKAVPKGPEDAANPYDKATNPEQWNAWMKKVMEAGHRTTKEP